MTAILHVAKEIGQNLRGAAKGHVVLIRSTVIPGTNARVREALIEGSGDPDAYGAEVVSIADLLNDVQHFLEAQLQRSETRIEIKSHTTDVQLRGNPQMLLSALINLSVNAIQAMGRGGLLRIEARCEDDVLDLRVIDNGPGIDAPAQEKVFSPFFTTRKEGTGLGLAVVAAVVRAHNGNIELQSIPEEGCTFILRIPMARAESGAAAPSSTSAYKPRSACG